MKYYILYTVGQMLHKYVGFIIILKLLSHIFIYFPLLYYIRYYDITKAKKNTYIGRFHPKVQNTLQFNIFCWYANTFWTSKYATIIIYSFCNKALKMALLVLYNKLVLHTLPYNKPVVQHSDCRWPSLCTHDHSREHMDLQNISTTVMAWLPHSFCFNLIFTFTMVWEGGRAGIWTNL